MNYPIPNLVLFLFIFLLNLYTMKVDKDIEIGVSNLETRNQISRKIVTELNVGDSVLVDCEDSKIADAWRGSIDYWRKKLNMRDRNVTLKKWDDIHYRIWRVK